MSSAQATNIELGKESVGSEKSPPNIWQNVVVKRKVPCSCLQIVTLSAPEAATRLRSSSFFCLSSPKRRTNFFRWSNSVCCVSLRESVPRAQAFVFWTEEIMIKPQNQQKKNEKKKKKKWISDRNFPFGAGCVERWKAFNLNFIEFQWIS